MGLCITGCLDNFFMSTYNPVDNVINGKNDSILSEEEKTVRSGKGKVTVQMWKHYCAIMGSVLFWGASYLATAVAYETISPLQLGLVRAVLAAALFFAYRALSGAREKVERCDWPRVVISGLFGVTLYFAFQNTALAMTSSSRAALITACYPVIVLTMECMVRWRSQAWGC